jgi:hypothetical protein
MDKRRMTAGVLALSALAFGCPALAADDKAPNAAEGTQDKRETRLVMLKLPAMV